jgi:hypothetical protein
LRHDGYCIGGLRRASVRQSNQVFSRCEQITYR